MGPAETPTEHLYRCAVDKAIDEIGAVMRSIRDAGCTKDGLTDRYGDILCDLAETQGFLFKVCAAGVNKDTDAYLALLIEDFKEISK